jgi:hypothetical protein
MIDRVLNEPKRHNSISTRVKAEHKNDYKDEDYFSAY